MDRASDDVLRRTSRARRTLDPRLRGDDKQSRADGKHMSDTTTKAAPFTFGQVYYLTDPEAHAEANSRGENYWDAYVPEILDELGVRGQAIGPDGLDAVLQANGARTVVIFGAGEIPGREGDRRQALDRWIRSGGILIGLMAGGLDALFGVTGVRGR